MFKRVFNGSPWLLPCVAPLIITNTDTVSEEMKAAVDIRKYREDNETGMDRVKAMVSLDEFGRISSELNAVYQAGFTGFLFGALYGGFLHSRNAYVNFMETNQATTFSSSFEAKKKLQDKVTVNFAKGAFKWGWRLCLFTTSYVAITTGISVYRGKSSIYEYLTAGMVTGAAYKLNMGLRGMVVGGGVGGVFGGVAGCISLAILKATGTSMQDVRYWQYKWKVERTEQIKEATAQHRESDLDIPLLHMHDEKVGTSNIDLSQIEDATDENHKKEAKI